MADDIDNIDADIGSDDSARAIVGDGAAQDDIDLANTNSARAHDLAVQASDNHTWLYKNIVPIMAVIVVVFSFSFFLILLKISLVESSRKEIAMFLAGGIFGILNLVIGYFFGSSKGSADKGRFIEKSKSGRRQV